MRLILLMAALAVVSHASLAVADDLFQDGDLVAIVGGTLVERAQQFGYWEAAIQLTNPGKTIHVRNLGWSADTVWAESRGEFDPPAKGYERMISQIKEMKPDVIIFGYGNAEALDGPDRLEAFSTQYRKLIEDLGPARRLFLSPIAPNEAAVVAATSQANYDRLASSIQQYQDAVESIANDYGAPLAHMAGVETTRGDELGLEFYEPNGIHLTALGYHASVAALLSDSDAPVMKEQLATQHGKIADLLDAITAKNQLVFYRWRPQNITYLALFRKHEQGNNYAEIPMFDPLIDKADARIDQIKRELAGN